jgi:Predicted nucleotide-binding protein containing TIR-like domain
MVTSSSKESSAARVSYATLSRAAESGRCAVTPLLRDRMRSAAVPLREIAPHATDVRAGTLPVMATAGDVRELVRFLKKREAGITLVAAMNSEQKRIFDLRKIAAYEFWGVISRDGERIRLTALGREIARRLEPEARVYRSVLDNIVCYRSVLEWVFRQGLDLVTHLDVAAYWQEHYPQAVDEHDEKNTEGSVVCFFDLCRAAELGTMTIGKRGRPARLHIERKELSEYILSGGAAPSVEMFSGQLIEEDEAPAQPFQQRPETEHKPGPTSQARPRLLISHGQRMKVIEQLRVALELAGIESETVERAPAASGPVAEHTLEAMRRCDRAVIVVTGEDCAADAAGRASLKEDLLVEIGAAFVFYDRRVVLLWDEAVPVPRNLHNLTLCRFAADKLTWEDGVSLMKAMRSMLRAGD